MTKEQFAARLKQACASVISAEQELTEIDSKFTAVIGRVHIK